MSLTSDFDMQQSQLAAIRASEIELTDGADAALASLGPPIDAIRMRATLLTLIRADRHSEAAALILGKSPDDKWIELATYIASYMGNVETARLLVQKADEQPDLTLMRRVRHSYAEGILERLEKQRSTDSLLSIAEWTLEERELARSVIDHLDPVLSLIRAHRAIEGQLQLEVMHHLIYSSWILQDRKAIVDYSAFLLKYVPIPLLVVELCLRRLIVPPPNLVVRLRIEHGSDYKALLLAAMAERDLFAQPEESLTALLELGNSVSSDEEKKQLCYAILETSGQCSVHRIDDSIQVVRKLRPDDNLVLGLLKSFQHIIRQDYEQATAQLNSIRDESSGLWWQAYAQLLEGLGDDEGAQQAWETASDLVPHPNVVRRSVRVSLDRRKFHSAVRNLKKLLASNPQSVAELRAMSAVQLELGNHAEAIPYLSTLVELHPTSDEYRLNLSRCLAYGAKYEDAITVLQPSCDVAEPAVEVVVFQSDLLRRVGRAKESFELLDSIAADNWDDPPFLLLYMNTAHAAANDARGHSAFERLLQLRVAGKVPQELMQEKTLDDLLLFGKELQERREGLRSSVIDGRLPWLLAEHLLNNPDTWAWRLHTQELKWLSEERLNRAALCVYSTNGFTIRHTDHGNRVKQISYPQGAIGECAVDLTSLITLHELGMLDKAASTIGTLLIPMSYGILQREQRDRFGQHQPSREEELRKLQAEIVKGRIILVGSQTDDTRLVDEYSDKLELAPLRLQDLIITLQEAQKASDSQLANFRKVAHRPRSLSDILPVGTKLLVDLTTLRTIAGQEVFDAILATFRVHITSAQFKEIGEELLARDGVAVAKQSHDLLWESVKKLASESKLRFANAPEVDQIDSEIDWENVNSMAFFDSFHLSVAHNNCLLADDRTLQAMRFAHSPSETDIAFGTDQLILKLLDESHLTLAEAAKAYRQLMKWRYRFLIPTSSFLHYWAAQSRGSLPGDGLLDVAVYLHDCLRDPGLLCGFEQSDPPMPIAAKFVTEWIEQITSFLLRLWQDASFSDDQAKQITFWVGEELIPSCPRGLCWHEVGVNIARSAAKTTLIMAMVKFAVLPAERANEGLRALAGAFCFDDEEFVLTAVEAINASR